MHYLGKGSLYFSIRGSGYLDSRFELYSYDEPFPYFQIVVFHSVLEPLQREVELQLNDVTPLLYPYDHSGALSLVQIYPDIVL